MRSDTKKTGSKGFTLVEALIAMVILGLAISALLVANRSFSTTNARGLELSTAEFLIEQVRERSVSTPFAGLGTLSGSFSPPHDSQGVALTNYPAYRQTVTVVQDANGFGFGPSEDFRTVKVDIYLNSELVSSASWLRANY